MNTQTAEPQPEAKRVHKIKNAAGEELEVKSFHLDGAVEIRATVLANGKRIDVHLFGVDEDLAGIRLSELVEPAFQEVSCPKCKGKTEDCKECSGHGFVAKHPDGARIEIGPQNISDLRNQDNAGPTQN